MVTKVAAERAWMPALLTLPKAKIAGIAFSKLTLFFETSFIFIGFGAFIGTRVGITMIVGMILNFAVLAPWMIHNKEIKHAAPTLENTIYLEFPLTIPAGSELAFTLEEAIEGPELEAGSKSMQLTKTWTDTQRYSSFDALVTDLNRGEGNADLFASSLEFNKKEVGVTVDVKKEKPVPFLPFTIEKPVIEKRHKLEVNAPGQIYWEARLALDESSTAAAFLGFAPGVENIQTVGSYRNIVAWTMWPGVGMMVVAGLLAFAFQWKTIGGAFSAFFKSLGRKKEIGAGDEDPLSKIEVPMGWFMIGFTFFGIIAMIIMKWLFDIPLWMGVIAVLMSFFLAIVSIRASGETGIIPIGAMGKVTQLTFGVLHPGSMTTNLMTANVTAGAATSASDMTNQFKVGHMVGAKTRLLFVAQVFGILTSLAVIPVFFIMVPDASAIGTQALPAPAAIVWAGVARLLSQGIGSLPPTAVIALIIASLFGAAVTILERVYPKSRSWVWLPSPAGMGIAMTVPALYSLSMFIGAMIALVLGKYAKSTNDMYTIPVASGFIAGESLTGVFFAILAALGG
ncbi:OPT/YSL family transporter [bacterium]|nr:OPT/YSL family transporter [bacterium]